MVRFDQRGLMRTALCTDASIRPMWFPYTLTYQLGAVSGFWSSKLICPLMDSNPFTADPTPFEICIDSIQGPGTKSKPKPVAKPLKLGNSSVVMDTYRPSRPSI